MTTCLLHAVECCNPRIYHGSIRLAQSGSDSAAGVSLELEAGTTEYGGSLQLFCNQGFFMDGPNITHCQADGKWTQLPICRRENTVEP